MKAIIHAGMSKTGSTSIQQSFRHLDHPDILYPTSESQDHRFTLGNGNHAPLTALLFNKDPETYPGFKAVGLTREELEVLKSESKKALLRNVHRSTAKYFILSAERISSMAPGMLKKLKVFVERNFDDHEVIAYVRPPIGYMSSVFQQRLKGNLRELELVWPKYRKRFEVIDDVFGRDKVTLKKFDRNLLYKGDVVSDFAKFLDIEIRDDQIIHRNVSLSLEATALLYVQRKYGYGNQLGSQEAVDKNFRFTRNLANVGEQKLRFSNVLLTPILDENQDDLSWIEDRLGASMRDSAPQTGTLIGSEKDLIDVAWAANELIGRQIASAIESTQYRKIEDLVRNVELYRTLTAYDQA